MIRFKSFLIERLHSHENDPKMATIDAASSSGIGSRVYKVINEKGQIVLTTDGMGNSRYLRRKELVQELRRIAYNPDKKSDYALSQNDFSKDKKWTFTINNKPVASGPPKSLIDFLNSSPLKEDVEKEDDDQEREDEREREDKPKLFVIMDKETERKHSSHRSRVDADKALDAMDDEDRKKYKIQIQEAAYKGNIGFTELTMFYRSASVKEKGELDKLIRSGNHKEAWSLVMRVTKTKLVGLT